MENPSVLHPDIDLSDITLQSARLFKHGTYLNELIESPALRPLLMGVVSGVRAFVEHEISRIKEIKKPIIVVGVDLTAEILAREPTKAIVAAILAMECVSPS